MTRPRSSAASPDHSAGAPANDPTSALPPGLRTRIAGDDANAADAILVAAAELFTTQGPARVSLREVAERAGVNYGLIHRHFGTKEGLLVALFRHYTDYGRTFIDDTGSAAHASAALLDAEAGNFAKMLTWAVLDAMAPDQVFTDTSALDAYSELIDRAWQTREPDPSADRHFDPRVVAGLAMLNIMIWDLYAPYIRQLSGLDDRSLDSLRAEVLDLLHRLVHTAGDPAAQRRVEPPG